MKKDFFDTIIKLMAENTDLWFLSAGLGWPRTDELQKKHPDRFVQCECAEQTTLDIACGIAYAKKIPVVYSITPFLLYRGFETIRTYINHENIPVILIGAGRDDEYSEHDGFSHYAGDDWMFMQHLKQIHSYWPENTDQMRRTLRHVIDNKLPSYINLKR